MATEELRVRLSLVDQLSGALLQSLTSINPVLGIVAQGGILAAKAFIDLGNAGREAQLTVNDLRISLEVLGKGAEELEGKLEGTVKQIHAATRFDDEEIRRGLTGMIQLTGQVEASERSLAAVADLAAARHLSFAQAAESVARAVEGQARALRGAGIILSASEQALFKYMTTAERFEFIQGKIEQHFSGARLSDMRSFDAQWQHFENTLKDWKEKGGEPVAEMFAKILARVNEALPRLKEFATTLLNIHGGGGALGMLGQAWGYGGINGAPGASDKGGLFYESQYDLLKPINRAMGLGAGQGLNSEQFGPATAANMAIVNAYNRAQEEAAKKADTWRSATQQLDEEIKNLTRELEAEAKTGVSHAATLDLNGKTLLDVGKKAELLNVSLSKQAQHWVNDARAAEAFMNAVKSNGFAEFVNNMGTDLGNGDPIFGPPGQAEKRAADLLDFISSEREKSLEAEYAIVRADAEKIMAMYENWVRGPLSDLMTEALTGGDVEGVLNDMWKRVMKEASGNLIDALSKELGKAFAPAVERLDNGMFKVGNQFFSNEGAANSYAQNQGFGQGSSAVGGALAAGAAIYNANQAAKQGQSPIMTIGTLGLAGFEIGGPYGAVVGVIVGAIISIMNDTIVPAVEKYAIPKISDGLAGLDWTAGFDAAESRVWLQKIQEAFDTFRNGYLKIALALPEDLRNKYLPEFIRVFQQVGTGNIGGSGPGSLPFGNTSSNPQFIGTGTPGDPYRANPNYIPPDEFNRQASGGGVNRPRFGSSNPGDLGFPAWNPDAKNPTTPAEWGAWMNRWIQNQLPQNIMERYRTAIEPLLEGMGVTVDKFNEIWKTAEGMDPRKALSYLANYVQVLANFNDLMEKIATPVGIGGGTGLFAQLRDDASRSFFDQLKDADKRIIDFGASVQLLTGQDQIDAANQLTTMIQDRYNMEVEFIKQISQMLEDAARQKDQILLGLQLQGKSPEDQLDILTGRYNDLQVRLANATTPQQAQEFYQELLNVIMQMNQIAQQIGGDAAEQYRTWAIDAVNAAYNDFTARLRAMGDAMDSENQAFLAQFQPIFDSLTTATGNAATSFLDVTDNVDLLSDAAAAAAVNLMALAEAAGAAAGSGFVSSTRESRAA